MKYKCALIKKEAIYLLNVCWSLRGTKLTMFLGSQIMAKIIKELVENVEFERKERYSKLSYAGIKKISRLTEKLQ